jgi:hypothetical protein
LLAIGLGLGLALGTATGDAWKLPAHPSHLTFTKPVALPGVVLPPGAYTFELPSPQASAHIVRVLSRDRLRVYYTGYTLVVPRPARLPKEQLITFGESRPDAPVPITGWFPLGFTTGNQFIYP